MRKILATTAFVWLWLGGAMAMAATPDASSPQLTTPEPDETAAAAPVYTVTATAASNYVFRGVSQSADHGAIFGMGRVAFSGFYAGVGAESVDFHTSTKAEYDLSAGWAPVVDGFRFDLGVVRYGYIDQPSHTDIDTVELKAVVLHDFGPATLGAAVFWSGNYFGSHKDDVYVEGRGAYKLTPRWTVSGAVGRQSGGLSDHTTWNAGATYAITRHVGLDLRYADTDQHSLGKTYRSQFIAAIKASF